MTGQLALFPQHVVRCFACPHTVDAADPDVAHEAMEAHYRARHRTLIEQLGYPAPACPGPRPMVPREPAP